MDRRTLLLFLSMLGLAPIGLEAKTLPPQIFVQNLYEKKIASDHTTVRLSDEEFLAPFTPELRALWRKAQAVPVPSGTLAGPIHNVWFGQNALPGMTELIGVRPSGLKTHESRPAFDVDLKVRDEPRTVRVFLLLPQDTELHSWLIADIQYPELDTLSQRLQARIEGRSP